VEQRLARRREVIAVVAAAAPGGLS
jgi:hypothetical protein